VSGEQEIYAMPDIDEMIDRFRVSPGKSVRLKDFDSAWKGDPNIPKEKRKEFAQNLLTEDVSALSAAQDLLYASDSWSVLVIFQAMDAAGKDGTIKHVMSGVNPQGVQVYSFKHPSPEELDHDFLWRSTRVLPERGRIGIFNRSYYEEVLIVRVHPELVGAQKIPDADVGKAFWKDRYDSINNLERHLTQNGTLILKFFLHLSKDEQRERFLARINDPQKHWKFSPSDIAERAFWKDYQEAYEEMLEATSTKWAPWYVIPADHKWVSRAAVAAIVVREIKALDLKYPEVTDQKRQQILKAKKQLENE
jgi:PPK2 family polyphosphate:nucleotide phosphotransferase